MNLRYSSREIAEFYSCHRQTWDELYPSEQTIFARLAGRKESFGSVLDVGCAAGGLGRALAERSKVSRYTGIDINREVIQAALLRQEDFPVPCSFICGDIVDNPAPLLGQQFDLVCSLSCADWNLEPLRIIQSCWEYVAPGGHLVLSLRLTNRPGLNDLDQSYQYIHFGDGPLTGGEERANYVVFNIHELLGHLSSLKPGPNGLLAYGYWGKPSPTAVTPYERLVFAVFALEKNGNPASATAELILPLDLLGDRSDALSQQN